MYRKLATALAVSTAFIWGSAAAAVPFDSVDKNDNDKISKEELTQSNLFESWDGNNDGKLSEGEAAQHWSKLSDADEDKNGYLNEDEFYIFTWTQFNEDENAHIDNGEWDDAGDAGWFDV